MRWSYIAFFSVFVDLIQSQVVPGSYLGFPNCTDPCNYIVVNPASTCDIFAVNQTQTSFITCLCKDTTLFASIVNCVVSICTEQETETSFEIAAGACHNQFLTNVATPSLGLTLATPSVKGFTLSASFPPLQTTISIPPTTPTAETAVSEASAVTPTISYPSNVATSTPNSNITATVATPTLQTNMTATASSNSTTPAAYTGGANVVVANKLLAGFGLSLYYAFC